MKIVFYFLLFAFLNFIAWNYAGIVFVLNVAIILYIIELVKYKKWLHATGILYSLLLIFNLSSTFWLLTLNYGYYTYFTFFANALLMLPVLVLTLFISRKNRRWSHVIFPITWILAEYLYTQWYLAWPWLNVGNVLGNQWYLVNWYAYVGIYGGALWLLSMGILIFHSIHAAKLFPYITCMLILLLLPACSLFCYCFPATSPSQPSLSVLACIPEYKPYKRDSNAQKTRLLLANLPAMPDSCLVVAPELFYTDMYPYEFQTGAISLYLKKILATHPKTTLVFGSEILNNDTIRFNGVSVLTKDTVLFRTKKRYVPIVEYTPKTLRHAFGNTYYSLNPVDDQQYISHQHNLIPFVCYESIFSDFVARHSAQHPFILILASEVFFKRSFYGRQQYLNIIRLRAIENNKYVLKCAYDGLSCVIAPTGEIYIPIDKEFTTLQIPKHTQPSFYQRIVSSMP